MAVLVAAALLTACGNEPLPTASPTPAGVGGSTSLNAAPDQSQAKQRSRQAVATAPAPELTLGELTDRINAQWGHLTHFREINSSTTGGTPLAGTPGPRRASRSVREVALPGRARYVAEENGQLLFEMIVIDERVFARGTVASLLDPATTSGEWLVTDLATVAGNPMLGDAAARQLGSLSPPAYGVPERLRPQPVRLLGETEFEGRDCTLYGAADTTATGARIDLTFAVDANDRLCYVETTSIGISSRYVVEELDESFTITAPTDARILASPVATPTDNPPATPAGAVATP